MVVNNPNNWHWVQRNALPWAQSYLKKRLTSINFEHSEYQVILKSCNITGDCDVSQRKGKVISIFDLMIEITLKIKKLAKDAEAGDDDDKDEIVLEDGILKIFDFIHDEEKFEYIYEKMGDYKKLIENEFLPFVLEGVRDFQKDLIEAHTKELQDNGEN